MHFHLFNLCPHCNPCRESDNLGTNDAHVWNSAGPDGVPARATLSGADTIGRPAVDVFRDARARLK